MTGSATADIRVRGKPLLRDRVRKHILDMIEKENLAVGDRLLSEQALAAKLDVSFLTVRAALEDLSRQGIIERRPGSGTFLKRRFHQGQAINTDADRMIAIVLSSHGHLYGNINRELIGRLQARDYIPIALTAESSENSSGQVLTSRLEQLVALGCRRLVHVGFAGTEDITTDAELLALILDKFDQRIHVGGAAPPQPEWDMHWVSVDLKEGHRLAMEHLAALGHERIAYLGGETFGDFEWSRSNRAYVRAYTDAMIDASFAERIQVLCFSAEPGKDEERRNQLAELVSTQGTTALCSMMDIRSALACKALRELEITVPDDVAVVGFYNTPWAEHEDLTSVDANIPGMADEVGRLLELELDSPPETRLVKPSLVVRHSTGRHSSVAQD